MRYLYASMGSISNSAMMWHELTFNVCTATGRIRGTGQDLFISESNSDFFAPG